MQIDVSKVTTVYTGKPGCMCGCQGKYSTRENMRSLKIIVGKLQRDPDTKFDEQARCFHVNTGTRQLAAYIDKE